MHGKVVQQQQWCNMGLLELEWSKENVYKEEGFLCQNRVPTPAGGERPAGRLVTYRRIDQINKYIKKNRSQVSHYQIRELQV